MPVGVAVATLRNPLLEMIAHSVDVVIVFVTVAFVVVAVVVILVL